MFFRKPTKVTVHDSDSTIPHVTIPYESTDLPDGNSVLKPLQKESAFYKI